jgi:4-oxalocrotonate tautomerase
MPYVNVQITRGATRAQKQQLVADITRSLVSRFGKKPEHIHIVIDEIEPDNWGFDGVLTTDHLAAQPKNAGAITRTAFPKKNKSRASRRGSRNRG